MLSSLQNDMNLFTLLEPTFRLWVRSQAGSRCVGKLRLVSRGLYYAGVRSTTGVLVHWTEVGNRNYIGRMDEGNASQKTAMDIICTKAMNQWNESNPEG